MAKRIDVYLEIGAKRAFACAVDWPGWCRHGADAESALAELLACGPRYAAVVRPGRLGFTAPRRAEELRVVERLQGDATTDFGAPGAIAACDREPADAGEYARMAKVLRLCWRAFDAARKRAEGKALRKGPRGGGRELDAILRHVVEAELGYLNAFGWKPAPAAGKADPLARSREAILAGLAASQRGEIAARGPRGGQRWPVRYFVRRVAWHAVAHAWEIERRSRPDHREGGSRKPLPRRPPLSAPAA